MKRTILIILVFAGVFVCGGVVGGALSARHFHRFVEDKGANRSVLLQMRDVGEKLALTPEQKKKGRVIFERSMKDRQAAQKQMQVINDRLVDDLNELLTPEQRIKYKELQAQQRTKERQWQRWVREQRDRRGGNPPLGPDGKPLPPPPFLERRERERSSGSSVKPEDSTPPSTPTLPPASPTP